MTMEFGAKKFLEERESDSDSQKPVVSDSNKLVRVPKAIVKNPIPGKRLDPNFIMFDYYNCFNYNLLPRNENDVRLALGITSANPGEGKTLVASNLAVSLTMGYQKKTVLVDLNFQRPAVHQIFGTTLSPGLVEALYDGTIHVSPTKIPQLFVLAAGSGRGRGNGIDLYSHRGSRIHRSQGLVGLEQMAAFGDIIYSLQQEYDFIIVDMPAINTGDFPILFSNRLSGLLVVVDTTKTKRADLDKMFRHLNENQVLGFILNRVKDDEET